MYDVNKNNAQQQFAEVGKLSNQLIDFKDIERANELGVAADERKAAAKAKAAADKDADIYSQLSQMGGKAIMPHDMQLISDKGQGVRNYVVKNIDALRNGNPAAQMEYNRLLSDYQTTVGLSVDKRQRWETTNQTIAANPSKFRQDAKDKQWEFASSEHAGQFDYAPDLTETFDTQAYVKNTIRPLAEDLAVKGEHDYINPTTGVKTTYTTNNLTPEETDKLFHDSMLANPQVYSQEQYKLSQDPEAQKKFGNDVNAYIKDQYYDQFKVNRNKQSIERAPRESEWEYKLRTGQGDVNDEINTKPSTYKIKTSGTQFDGKETSVDANVESLATARLGKNVAKDLKVTEDMRDYNGNKLPEYIGVYPVTGSDLTVVATYKTGSKDAVSGRDISGNIIPTKMMDNALKNKGVEYRAMFNGIMKVPEIYNEDVVEDGKIIHKKGDSKNKVDGSGNESPIYKDISITVPADHLKGGLGKSEETVEKMNKIAEEKNKSLNGSKSEENKSTETKLTPDQWNKDWSALPKGKTMVGLDGKTYTKK